MKFSCSKEVILSAVSIAAKAASAKSAVAALEGLLLELSGDTLTITGYNLEIGIKTSVTVSDGVDGVCVINAKMLSDVIRKMPSGIIDIEIDDKCAYIRQSVTELMVMCMAGEEYPPIPQANLEGGFTLSQKTLKSMISQTRYACATIDTKPALTGCLFEIKDGILNVVAVDGIRIALRQEPIKCEDTSFIVPARTLDELVHLLSDEDDRMVTAAVERNQISFKIDNYTMISRLVTGEFLDYRKHLGLQESFVAKVKCREIIDVLDRAMLFLNDKNKSPLRCEFNGDYLNINCSTTLGKINDKINISYNGAPITIGFNAKFLLDAFKAADTDTVNVLLTSSAVSPVMIVPVEGEEFKFFLLPMRLK